MKLMELGVRGSGTFVLTLSVQTSEDLTLAPVLEICVPVLSREMEESAGLQDRPK